MEPIGAHQFWGYSPALDVQQVHSTVFGAHANEADDASTPLNILLVNAGDARHVLKTIAQRFRHSVRPLHFYVYERSSEVLARHMLQLAVACDWELPLRQRTAVWLELYGNALLQARTARYLGTKLKSVLIDVLCNERGPAPLPALWDLSLLKYKQRDELEATLKAWDEAVPFDMATLRDYRLRHHYGERYDHRNNLIDWDYQTGVRPCAGSIHYTTFREWRNSGVAFEFGDQVYSEPNRTLASYVEGKEAGRGSVSRRGFWGDILVGPYHAVGTAAYVPTDAEAAAAAMARGLQSAELAASAGLPAAPVCAGPSDTAAAAVESLAAAGVASTVSAAALAPGTAAASTAADAAAREAGPDPRANYAWQLFDIQGRHLGSEQWRHHAVEVAVYNVLCWLFEIETGRQYAMRREHDVYSGLAEANLIPAAYAAATAASARAMPTATRAAAVAAVADSGATGAGDAAETAQQGTGTCSASGAGAASHAAAAGAAAASEPVGPPPALLRAEAAARARTIGRAFQGVTISWMAGDMAEWMARGKLAGRFHAVLLSGRSVHLLDKPGFSALAAPEGCVLVAETARNVLHLKREQQAEYARRVAAMVGAAGAVVVGGDRAISADTYSVGTVMDPKRLGKGPAGAGPGPSAPVSGFSTGAAAAAAPLFSRDAAPFLGAIHGSAGGLAAAAGGVADASGGDGARRRVKNVPMSALAHAPLPHPAVASLLAAAAASGGDSSSAVTAAARVAAGVLVRAVRDGIAAHEVEGGDNPHPEALVFALLPAGGAAAAVKEAVLSALPLKPASHGEIAGSTAEGAAVGSVAASIPSPAP